MENFASNQKKIKTMMKLKSAQTNEGMLHFTSKVKTFGFKVEIRQGIGG